MFFLLLKVRLVGLWNTAVYAPPRRKAFGAVLGVLGVGIGVAIYRGFHLLLRVVAPQAGAEEMVYQVFYFLFLFLLAGALPFVASTLLHSTDYLLLGAAPLRTRWVVAAKLIDAAVSNSLQFVVLGVPALLASASALGIGPAAWLPVLIVVVLFALLPALLTALLLLGALAAFGAKRVRGAITAANAIMATGVCLTMVFQANHLPIRQGLSTLLSSQPNGPSAAAHYGPSGWCAQALVLLGHGETLGGWVEIGRLAIVSGLLFTLCMLLGGRLLSPLALAEHGEGEMPKRLGPPTVEGYRHGILALFSSPVAALVAKDLKYIMRDSVLLSQLGMPTILFLVPFALALQSATGALGPPADLYPFAAAMTAIIVFMQTSILSLSSVGLESRSFWLILSSPNGGRTVLWAKFVMSTFVSAGAGIFLTILGALAFRAPWAEAAVQAAVMAMSAAALCGMGVGISAALPRFVYENPAHRVSVWALILGFVGTTAYIVVTGILLGLVYVVAATRVGPPALVYAVGATLFLLITSVSAFVPMSVGARRIEAYQWEH